MSAESMIWSHYGKAVMLLLIITVILQAYHMTALMKLHDRNKKYTDVGAKMQKKPVNDIDADMKFSDDKLVIKRESLLKYEEQFASAHIMDSSGTYMIIPNIVTPISDSVNETLSICSQTTANHLHYLKDLTETWQGEVSVTVFTHSHEAVFALYSIAYMHACFEKVQNSVRFHVAYPISHPPINLNTIVNMEMHCDSFVSLINENEFNYNNQIPYPHNVLRNIAITYSSTPYIFMIDIDMIPSQDLNNFFKQFISRRSRSVLKGDNNENIVYVVPAFESHSDRKTFDKQSLLKEWDSQNVRPFYKNVCWKCQVVTDYDKWRELPTLSFLDVGYTVEWEDPWEPFYITRKEQLPQYDGRFKQYGFNRISQVCELHIAGYQFAVLNNAFVVHKGFKEPAGFHTKKDEENDRNRKLFQTFKEDLKERYPQSNRKC